MILTRYRHTIYRRTGFRPTISSTIMKFVSPDQNPPQERQGRRKIGGAEAEQGGKIHLVISQAIMPRRRGRARMAYSYLTPMWARDARLADHRRQSLARPTAIPFARNCQ